MVTRIGWLLSPLSMWYWRGIIITHCTLCDHERLAILERLRENPDKLINSCDELFGSCRHKTKFHRYVSTDSSTDDSIEEEKVGPMKVTTEV